MKSLSIVFVTLCHAALFFALIGIEGELLIEDLSSEGLSETQLASNITTNYPHQSNEYIIAVIDSDWIFPNYIEPPKVEKPDIKNEPIAPVEAITPPPKKIESTQKPEPKQTKEITQTAPKKQHSTDTRSQKSTGSGQRNAIGQGTGKNTYDGPAGFSNGNSQQTLLNNIQRCYPLISRKRGEQGVAVVRIHVDANGQTTHTELIQSTKFSRLDNCALESVRSLKVKPKIMNGKSTASYFDQTIRFRLN